MPDLTSLGLLQLQTGKTLPEKKATGQYPPESQTHKSSNMEQTEPSQCDIPMRTHPSGRLPDYRAGSTHGQTVCSAQEWHEGENVPP